MTIHGRSRFPGLNIWARNNQDKIPVKMPPGHLLVQAGRQLEWVTGGVIQAGYHEVLITEDTIKSIEKRKDLDRPLWRVSSTLFNHIQPDLNMQPINELKVNYPDSFNEMKYPKILAHDMVMNELSGINLFKQE